MSRVNLKLYENRYFKLNTILLRLLGLWPFVTQIEKRITRTGAFFLILFIILPYYCGMMKWCPNNLNNCLENSAAIVIGAGIITRYIALVGYEKKSRSGFIILANVWSSLESEEERLILEHFAIQGRKILLFFIYSGILTSIFMVHGVVWSPVILDFFNPLNESRPKLIIIHGEFYIDPYENYYKIYLINCIQVYFGFIAIYVADSNFLNCVLQNIGIFNITKYRLNKAVNRRNDEDYSYSMIISAIKIHQKAYQFADKIEETYSFSFFLIMGILIFCLGGPIFYMIEVRDSLQDVSKAVPIVFGSLITLGYFSLIGQYISNKSSEIFFDLYSIQWYEMPRKSKQLLKFMMLRSMKPCYLTCGGMFILNHETAGNILRLTASYTMIALSLCEEAEN